MPKFRRPSRAARVLVPGAVAVVLLAGCAQGSGDGLGDARRRLPTTGPATPGSPPP
ncbi:hypothetical protein O1L60_01995 [Streptomyces diastatochromogenes]|nr:hypothetical protein [Streptomyces diastatochromogenes]